eukprot:CAMPEP_0196750896 /NCGR_PEP_ID=MMETSP1091-20130531/81989_1 /TAXON_ID=302021 /ORGANISM="Rhodomonas sp., Strain CCMP768" /LENGTH=77 /DNA_ID=CAMNT_0042098587 /DNA_START=144 /DNA_END=374 /DNA_ORIENTATION=-
MREVEKNTELADESPLLSVPNFVERFQEDTGRAVGCSKSKLTHVCAKVREHVPPDEDGKFDHVGGSGSQVERFGMPP